MSNLQNKNKIKSKTLVVISDTHENTQAIENIRNKYKATADLLIHCGDSELPKDILNGYLTVQGNQDIHDTFPLHSFIDIGKFKFVIMHGHTIFGRHIKISDIARVAKQKYSNVIIFGHSHTYLDEEYDGIRILNPGALYHPKYDKETYMIITVYENEIKVEKKYYYDEFQD